ncbi:MAG: efflux RND transporter permease subunit [Gammaproteobacteria bacterium]|nr:efflux RND transporter permease subunit [Gammaproteobacteria bacterium]
MSRFNLSAWALANRALVSYFMLLLGLSGVWAYFHLGQSEDPPFTFRIMVVRTLWPGATADEVDRLVTEKIEEKLQELNALDYLRSYSRPGESQIFIIFREDGPAAAMPENYYQARKKVSDIRHTLPAGVIGPSFNDEFADTFGNIYALQGADFSYAELKEYAERVRDRLLRIADVAKVNFIGLQEERIFVDIANTRRAELGIPAQVLMDVLAEQNGIVTAGSFDTSTDKIYARVSGSFTTVEDVENLPIEYAGRTFRLGDIATVYRGYQDPPAPRLRFNGQPAIGIAVSMEKGGDIIQLGQRLDLEFERLNQDVPLGMSLARLADQPLAVRDSVTEFVMALAAAVVIVLLVCFLSLGVRTGLVVALSIPLVLAMTFAAMHYLHIGLHKTSLGALVIALGLLVDDAIIAVEMMAVKLEEGFDRFQAASFAYTSTAFPMLSGTLITAAGFLPIVIAKSMVGEYTVAIFQVTVIALLLSWVAAVVFVPLLGYALLPEKGLSSDGVAHDEHAVYHTSFYNRFRALVQFCVRYRWLTIVTTAAVFAASLVLFSKVPQQFFPDSVRLELLVDLKLPEGASIAQTDLAAARLEEILAKLEGVDSYAAYIGSGAPRFILPLDQQLPAQSFAQFVINTRDFVAREQVRAHLIALFPTTFPDLRWRVNRIENGPPVGYVLQYRVSGPDRDGIRLEAEKVAAALRDNPHAAGIHLDTAEQSKVLRIVLDQDRARSLGVSSQMVAMAVAAATNGVMPTTFREDNELIDIVLRGPPHERQRIELLGSLAIPTASGTNITLAQVAKLEYRFEDGILWRRNHVPTITVRADIYSGMQPPEVVAMLAPALARIEAALPRGYRIELGGTVADSGKAQASVMAGMPFLILVVLTVLMVQLKSFSQTAMVFLTAPLGIIGVAVFLLLFRQPFGFIAMLGTIALFGMIMRNSVILIDQIRQDLAQGRAPFDAVVEATVRRFRPIVLTSLAAVLAMIPLSGSVFFGPMAVAIMGGLIAATVLTLLFLPALYAAWFRVPRAAAEQ